MMYETTIEIRVREMCDLAPNRGFVEHSNRVSGAIRSELERRAAIERFDAQAAFQEELASLLQKYDMCSCNGRYIPIRGDCDYERTIEKLAALIEMSEMVIPSMTQYQVDQLAMIFEELGYEIPVMEMLQNLW